VVDMRRDGAIWHRIPGHTFSGGQAVRGEVDWSRRYDLMRAHTGEHLLFSRLLKLIPDIQLVKIAITSEKKSFVIRGKLDWQILLQAELEAQACIDRDLDVAEKLVNKDDPSLQETRIKIERIHGDKVRIVSIGDIDQAACAGVHVKSTGEIKMILVTKLISAKPTGDYEIEFEVGEKALDRSINLSWIASVSSDLTGSQPQDLPSAIANLRAENERMKRSLERSGERALAEIGPKLVNGYRLYYGLFEEVDKKALSAKASELTKKEESACILGTVTDRLMIIVACHPRLDLDCSAILNSILSRYEGRGGGSRSFATGGMPTIEGAREAMEEAERSVQQHLEQLNAGEATAER